MVNKKRLAFSGILIALVSAYLTYIEYVFALNTKLKCLYIFGYFCITGTALVWLRKRFIPKGSKYSRLIAGLLALVLLIGNQGFFLPLQQECLITLSAVGENGEPPHKEIWLSAIEIDGEGVALKDIAVENDDYWILIPEYDSYVFYPSENVNENWLTLRVLAKDVALRLEQNSWSGEVEIQDSTGAISRLNLTSDEATQVLYEIHTARVYTVWQRILLNTGAAILLYFVLEALIALVQINDKNRTNNKALIRGLIWCIGLISYGLLFFTNEKISPDLGTLFVLIGLTCAGAAVFSRRCAFRVEKTDVYLLFCAVYASFVSFGQRFFLDGNTRIHGSIEGTFYLLIGVIWFFPVLILNGFFIPLTIALRIHLFHLQMLLDRSLRISND